MFKDSHFIRNKQLLEANMSIKRTKYHFLKAQKPIPLESFVEFPNLLLLLRQNKALHYLRLPKDLSRENTVNQEPYHIVPFLSVRCQTKVQKIAIII